ncbi:MgtC/SapB family protein [Sunxiuqinia sp. A32]|uniref:MgtC/SapB family protein n=1 Tax=Sunxiuqinia sp. A32 TaxID=3461496 RepID=UPI00404683AC
MTNFLQEIPTLFIQFLLTAVFSFILGLEQRKHYSEKEEQQTFGTDRTFVFIGLLGFILLVGEPNGMILYLSGGLVVSLFLGIFYYHKIRTQKSFGLTTVILALLTYTFPLLITTQPNWLTMLIFVLVLILTESKRTFDGFTKKIDRSEFITLAKFIIIAGIILPAMPDKQIFTFLNLSPYKVWLAIVVISGISYLSYILRKFIFPEAGLILTGLLGGLYSSTATTIILAQKSKDQNAPPREYAAAIIIATAMMFLRIYILLLIFNFSVGVATAKWFITLFLVSLGTAYYLYTGFKKVQKSSVSENIMEDKNPLEFKVAIVFALLYVFFSFITQFTLQNFGTSGLNILSYIVGFSDIDPFLLNLFQGKYDVTQLLIAMATLQAILSNNILKMIYAKTLGNKSIGKYVLQGFGIIIVVNAGIILFLHLI